MSSKITIAEADEAAADSGSSGPEPEILVCSMDRGAARSGRGEAFSNFIHSYETRYVTSRSKSDGLMARVTADSQGYYFFYWFESLCSAYSGHILAL